MKDMIRNLNQEIRQKIYKHIEKLNFRGISTKDAIESLMLEIYNIEGSNEPAKQKYHDYFIFTIYADAYKMYSYKLKQLIASPEDIDVFHNLCLITDADDLLNEVSASPDLLGYMIEATYEFYRLVGIEKANVMESLSEKENKRISEIYPAHDLDIQTYTDYITLDALIKRIQEQINYYQEMIDVDFIEGVIISTCAYLRSLFLNNNKNGIEILLQLAEIDYQVSKYLARFVKDDTTLNDHLQLYESEKMDLIIARLYQEQEFLFDVVKTLIDVYIDGKYNEKSIPQLGEAGMLKKFTPNQNKED